MDDQEVRTHSFQSDDPDEVSDFIEEIYANNQFESQHAIRRDVKMAGQEWGGVGIYDVDYQMPFHFCSEESRPTYLFLSCHRGAATYFKGRAEILCVPGQSLPISADGSSMCTTGSEGFGHLSVIIDAERINKFLGQWVGRPVVEPLRFDLQPLISNIADQWKMAATCLNQMMRMGPIPHVAADSMIEHMLKIIVTGHRNNYSNLLADGSWTHDQTTRTAIVMIRAEPMRWKTLGAVAHALGCATNALDKGIRRQTGKSFTEVLYAARLDRLNTTLLKGDRLSFVGALRSCGFSISGRFVQEYHRRFGELPSATYRRNSNAAETLYLPRSIPDSLCESSINKFIDESLGKPISLADLALLVQLPEYAVISAFKERFSRTPMQYVIERKLEHVKWRLRNSSASILSIAIECGFGTQSYLTTTMKRHFGVTPGQYRDKRENVESAQR